MKDGLYIFVLFQLLDDLVYLLLLFFCQVDLVEWNPFFFYRNDRYIAFLKRLLHSAIICKCCLNYGFLFVLDNFLQSAIDEFQLQFFEVKSCRIYFEKAFRSKR